MTKMRGSKCYKFTKTPYTRKSKFKKKMYVRGGIPSLLITKFDMGLSNREYPLRVSMFSLQTGQILHSCMESARQVAHRYLSDKLGKEDFHFKIKAYPHQVCRYHSIAMGAGADRYSSGMARPYGKPVALAAQVKAGQEIMYLEMEANRENDARIAFKKASSKLPLTMFVDVTKKPKVEKKKD
ncbi:50S ribosomal protein L10e [Candidatus Tiddalikarchaeum anstoanum]|nr:50S ribosomal protein L10e [Candidatus Tiddalikarchaeum anstoanum]